MFCYFICFPHLAQTLAYRDPHLLETVQSINGLADWWMDARAAALVLAINLVGHDLKHLKRGIARP